MRRRLTKIAVAGSRIGSMAPAWTGEVFRFLIGGVLNTVVGYSVYLLLFHWVRYEVAYAIAYITAIAVSYVFNAMFVFRQPMRVRSALYYPLVYLAQFLLGLILLKVLIGVIHVSAWLAPLLVSVLTIPMTFLLSRIIVRAQ
jgi:putative flippase GtrA